MAKQLKISGPKDQFVQGLYLSVTQLVVDTLTFSNAINLGVGLLNQTAILIRRIMYVITSGVIGELTADGDRFECAVVGDNTLTGFSLDQSSVYHVFSISQRVLTAVGAYQMSSYPMVDFTNLPGGGLLVPADRLYLAIDTNGFAAVQSAGARIYFSLVQLDAAGYLELAQTLRTLK